MLDEEMVQKRLSQIEIDINQMNQMIDENLEQSQRELEQQLPQKVGEENITQQELHAEEEETETVETKLVETEIAKQEVTTTVETSPLRSEAEPAAPDNEQTGVESNLMPEGNEMEQPTEPPKEIFQEKQIEAKEQATMVEEQFEKKEQPAPSLSPSLSQDIPSPIVLSKNGATTNSFKRSANPFRVVSVSSNHDSNSNASSAANSRKPSMEYDTRNIQSASSTGVAAEDGVDKLQQRHEYLVVKCSKLQKEIKYLTNMNAQGTLSIEDMRKLSTAIDKLQEYLDRKLKEKYDVGVLLSRKLRKQIDRGDNGQFWVGTK